MTDRITPERMGELREWVRTEKEEAEQIWGLLDRGSPKLGEWKRVIGICSDLLALLSEARPAPPTSGERERLSHHFQFLSADCPGHDLDDMVRCPKCEAIRSLVLSAPAPPTCGGEVERARMVLDTAIDLAYAYDLAEKDISDAYNEAKTALRYLLSILSAPKTVTREWVEDITTLADETGYLDSTDYEYAKSMLRELGITVEDKSEGEDEPK